MYAKYTVVLRDIMTSDSTRDKIESALSKYPLYSNPKTYDLIPTREQLNTKLLNHYKYREIGFETVGRFLEELEITMCEIMPHYNELFKTIVIMAELDNPFDNVDIVESFNETRSHSSESSGSSNSSTTGSGNQTANGKHIESDTPQGSLTIGTEGINNVDYASKAQWNEDKLNSNSSSAESGSSTTTNTGNDTVSHTYTKKGNQGVNTYAHDMNEFRTSIIDVVEQIITDERIAELFMMMY